MKTLSFVLTLFLTINMGVLYIVIFFGRVPEIERRLDLIERRLDSMMNQESGTGDSQVLVSDDMVILSDQQKDEIAEDTADLLEAELGQLVAEAVAENQPEEVAVQTTTPTASEYYIPVGQGSATSENQWKDLPVEVKINLDNYGTIKSTSFEATLRVPTGNGQVQARLYDTQSGIVGGSEIVGESSDGVFVRSGNLNILSGERTLRLQIRTTLNFEGVIENARVVVKT